MWPALLLALMCCAVTSASASLAAREAATADSGGTQCPAWCDRKAMATGVELEETAGTAWERICRWEGCQGCSACQGPPRCDAWCSWEGATAGWEGACELKSCEGCTNCYTSNATGGGVVYIGLSRRGDTVSLNVRDCAMYAMKENYRGTMGLTAPFLEPQKDAVNFWNQGTPAQKDCKANRAILQEIDGAQWFQQRDGKPIGLLREMFRGVKPPKNRSAKAGRAAWQPPLCWAHHSACMSIPELGPQESQRQPGGCSQVVAGCRSALRHLHSMMFTPSATGQVCNNFALKSVRGAFHDAMTSWVEGSILHELQLGMNTGLCRWGQYVSVLADVTRCAPGTIISMAAFLGFQSCGVDVFDHEFNNQDTMLPLHINRAYPCKANVNPSLNYPASHPHSPLAKRPEFSDHHIMESSKTNEDFWARIMNGTAFSSRYYMRNAVTASMMAHSIGRVTCSVEGEPKVRKGFWDEQRIGAVGEEQLRTTFRSAAERLARTQCDRGGVDCSPNGGENCNGLVGAFRRAARKGGEPPPLTAAWKRCIELFERTNQRCGDRNSGAIRQHRDLEVLEAVGELTSNPPRARPPTPSETNANIEGSFCNMPLARENFPPVAGLRGHTIPASAYFPAWKSVYGSPRHLTDAFLFLHAHDNMGTWAHMPMYSRGQPECRGHPVKLSLAFEVSRVFATPLPADERLRPFEAITWDGVGTTDSAWDSCSVACSLVPESSTLCGGPGISNHGNFSFA